jgi:hypothetical protein
MIYRVILVRDATQPNWINQYRAELRDNSKYPGRLVAMTRWVGTGNRARLDARKFFPTFTVFDPNTPKEIH